MRVSSADWFKAGVARQRADPISLGIAPRACTILSKLLLLLPSHFLRAGQARTQNGIVGDGGFVHRRRTNEGPASQGAGCRPAQLPTTLTTPGAPMARGGRVPDGSALSPSSAIPGACLMQARRLRHTHLRRNPRRDLVVYLSSPLCISPSAG